MMVVTLLVAAGLSLQNGMRLPIGEWGRARCSARSRLGKELLIH
jgi:hypothetical protein